MFMGFLVIVEVEESARGGMGKCTHLTVELEGRRPRATEYRCPCHPMPPSYFSCGTFPLSCGRTSVAWYFRQRFFIQRTARRSMKARRARLRKPYLAVPAKRWECLTGVS